MTFKLNNIPSTYAGWQVPIIMDGEGKVYIGQTGKVPGVTSWGFSVWLKRGPCGAGCTTAPCAWAMAHRKSTA